MLRRARLVTVATLCAALVVGLSTASAQAAVAKVGGVSSVRQDFYNATVTVRWKAVARARYQVRWAGSKAGLARAVVRPAIGASATSPALARCVTSYVQVRAVKGAVVGPWSAAKGVRFTNRRPVAARLSGVGLPNAVRFTWSAVPNATRYRVRWNAAPFGKFPGAETFVDRTSGGWTGQTVRSSTLQLPTTPRSGDKMMGVAYANPVFAQIEANNACKPEGRPRSVYVPVFPKAPDPGAGDRLRFASYNVELFPVAGSRLAAIADNIAGHGAQVVALQEANLLTAAALVSRLGQHWSAVPGVNGAGQQILYRNDAFRLAGHGSFAVPNPRPGASALVTPWAKLDQTDPSDPGSSQSIMVVSLHLAENTAASNLAQKASTGAAARVAINQINAINTGRLPVISAGDYRYMREPFCDDVGPSACRIEAPPTFVRSGYYDAMAAVTKVGVQYTTVNGHSGRSQVPSSAGVASRADYVMLKGFRGSNRYENVVNRFIPGTSRVTPSDHNMVLVDVTIPYAP